MTNDPTQTIEYDPAILAGLSDHILLTTKIRVPYISDISTGKNRVNNP
jgi:hypothetical protein